MMELEKAFFLTKLFWHLPSQYSEDILIAPLLESSDFRQEVGVSFPWHNWAAWGKEKHCIPLTSHLAHTAATSYFCTYLSKVDVALHTYKE